MNIEELSPKEAQEKWSRGEAMLVDVRQEWERKQAHIQDSIWVPLDCLKLEQIPKDKIPIFYCKAGVRSLKAAKQYCQQLDLPAFNLSGGIDRWTEEKMPVKKERPYTISARRKADMTRGALIGFCLALGYFVSPYFFLGCVFLSCEQIFSGWTGICFLEIFFGKYS